LNLPALVPVYVTCFTVLPERPRAGRGEVSRRPLRAGWMTE